MQPYQWVSVCPNITSKWLKQWIRVAYVVASSTIGVSVNLQKFVQITIVGGGGDGSGQMFRRDGDIGIFCVNIVGCDNIGVVYSKNHGACVNLVGVIITQQQQRHGVVPAPDGTI